MSDSTNLGLPYLAAAQAQKHVTVNEALRRLDALVQLSVVSATTTAQPASPADGAVYILPAGKTGAAWGAMANGALAYWRDGAWEQITPREGWLAWVRDTNSVQIYDGAWRLAFTLDPATGNFGVGASAPMAPFEVNAGAGTPDATLISADTVIAATAEGTASFSGVVAGSGAGNRMVFRGVRSRGKVEAPAAGASGDFVVSVLGAVYDGAEALNTASIDYLVDGTVSAGAGPQRISFSTGTGSTRAERARITSEGRLGVGETAPGALLHVDGGGVLVGNPTGGDKGVGALNAQAVYDDNTLLSCYVFDQALDGAVDLAKWDAKTPDRRHPAVVEVAVEPVVEIGPDGAVLALERRVERETAPERVEPRRHEPLRKFAACIGGAHDPLTLDGYARHWREKRHLTSLPNEAAFDAATAPLSTGEWVQRLIETVEIQAVLIEALNQRLKALEGA